MKGDKGLEETVTEFPDTQDSVVENVKARLQEEGREARNLVAYSLPSQEHTSTQTSTSGTKQNNIRRVTDFPPRRSSKQEKRPRSASAGRDPQASLRARHWGFLFRNLQQAVDEIYTTCEADESVVECKEAIMMLERYSNDFHKLIDWLKIKWEYEHTPAPQRPSSLAWEIRTSCSSPAKAMTSDKKGLNLIDTKRVLGFDGSKATSRGKKNSSGNKLGEKSVEDSKVKSKPKIIVQQPSIEEGKVADGNGNENTVVQKEEKLSKDDADETSSDGKQNGICNGTVANSFCEKDGKAEDENRLAAIEEVSTNKSSVSDEKIPGSVASDDKSKANKKITKKTSCDTRKSSLKDNKKESKDHSKESCKDIVITKSGSIEGKSTKESSKDISKESSKDIVIVKSGSIEESSKDHSKDSSKDIVITKSGSIEGKSSKESSKDPSKDSSKDIVITKSVCIEGKSTKESSNDSSKESSKEIVITKSGSIEGKSTKESLKEPSKESSKEISKESSKEIVITKSGSIEGKSTKESSKDLSKESSKEIVITKSGSIEGRKPRENKNTNLRVTHSSKVKDGSVSPRSGDSSQKTSEVKQSSDGKPEVTVAEKRSCAEVVQQSRSIVGRPGPTVYMNKASQVRQAFNQNRTPQKATRSASASNIRQSSLTRAQDLKMQVVKQQGSGGRMSVRRGVGGGMVSSPPTARRWDSSRSRSSTANASTTSGRPMTAMERVGLVRSNTTLSDIRTTKLWTSSASSSNSSWHNYERCAASNSSLSSSTSSSGLSWADKVRGTPTSHQSSQLSLQDEEGWEVVRRGRRSHGGSTASLNNQHNQQFSNRDSRSGSLKGEGHRGVGPKGRFNMPSSAMSLPSLAITEASKNESSNDKDNDETVSSKGKSSMDQSSKVTISKEQQLSYRKVKSQGDLVPSVEEESPNIKLSKSFRGSYGSSSKKNVTKKSEAKKHKAMSVSNEEIYRKTSIRKDNIKKNLPSTKIKRGKSENKENNENELDNWLSTIENKSKKCEKKYNKGNSKKGQKIENKNESQNNNKSQGSDNEEIKIIDVIKDIMSNGDIENDNSFEQSSDQKIDKLDVKRINSFDSCNSLETENDNYDKKCIDEEDKELIASEITQLNEANMSDKLEENSGDWNGDHSNIDNGLLANVEEDEDNESTSHHNDKDDSLDETDSVMDDELRYNAEALESAVQEEQRLIQQFEETEKTEIEVDEDDCECEDSNEVSTERATSHITSRYSSLLSSLSWADQVDPSDIDEMLHMALDDQEMVDAMESMETLRQPGRVLQIHEKLSSPSRKRSLSEKLRRHEAKLAKAEELRGKLMQAKTDKLKDLFKRIEEVRVDKDLLLDRKRELFEHKMAAAEEKRRQFLQEIINKAHDEDNKAKEIAFINGLEHQNKLHDIMQQHQSHEARLADIVEDRNRRLEEKQAKEAAAHERRKALETERQVRMAELCEKRRKRCERIDRRQEERREEILEQAREKAKDREERLTQLQQAQQAKECELVKKIQQKQEDTARRHEENMSNIRQKAMESSILKYSRGCDDAPRLLKYETKKLCILCNSLISSEVYLLSHLRGRQHQESLRDLHPQGEITTEDTQTYNLKHIVDAPANIDDPQVTRDKERQKALKKRCRKIRTRMTTRGKDYKDTYKPSAPKESPHKTRIVKALQQISKLDANQGSGPWPSSDVATLDKNLLELLRILEKNESNDQLVFSAQDGYSKINSLLSLITNSKEHQPCVLPSKSLGYCGRVLLHASRGAADNCRHVLYSNLSGTLIDYLMHRLNELVIETTQRASGSNSSLNNIVTLPSDPAATSIFELLSEVVSVVCDSDVRPASTNNTEAGVKELADATWQRLQDVVSYCVSVGLADKVSWYFNHVQGPVDNDTGVMEVILAAMALISALAKTLACRKLSDDPTQLIGTLHVTEMCGVVSLLYGLLLHAGGRSSAAIASAPTKLSTTTQGITCAGSELLHNLANLDLPMFQAVLGSEGISLELRHIASYLLWYCSHWSEQQILHNFIALVGFFTINNRENQMVIQSGEMPSVLQQLCDLPWPYFSEPHLTTVLFPTLLACCSDNEQNMQILQQEMSLQVLEDFLKNGHGENKPLVQILKRTYAKG